MIPPRPRPHDLLRICPSGRVIPADAPSWVGQSLAATPWVVIRRAQAPTGSLAVGVRGPTRAHRHALTLPAAVVLEIVTPHQLLHADVGNTRNLAAIEAFCALRPLLQATGLRWGPAGAVGFELATGTECVHSASDLDIAVYITELSPSTIQRLGMFGDILHRSQVRVDCQVECPRGAVSLTELLCGGSQLLVRSFAGPRLVAAHGVT